MTLQKLIDGKLSDELRRDGNTVNARLCELIKPAALKKALHDWPGIAPTFGTDGFAVHLQVVNQAYMDKHLEKQKAQSAGNKSRAKGEVPMEVSDDEKDVDDYAANTTLKDDDKYVIITELPSNVIITALDPGRKNAVAAARGPYISPEKLLSGEPLFTSDVVKNKTLGKNSGAVTITSAAYRHLTGCTGRAAKSWRRRRWRLKNDKEFAAAAELLKDSNTSTTDPAKLALALQARCSVFDTMTKVCCAVACIRILTSDFLCRAGWFPPRSRAVSCAFRRARLPASGVQHAAARRQLQGHLWQLQVSRHPRRQD
jgi:hypothetical protein